MGDIVRNILDIAQKSLHDPGIDYVTLARDTDHKINLLDKELEKKSVEILALRQPMAIDLRLVISSIRIAVMMERMGDLSKNTVKRAATIKWSIPEDIISQIDELISTICSMFDTVLDGIANMQYAKAVEECKKDAFVDQLYKKSFEQLQEMMKEDTAHLDHIQQVIFAIKNLERVGDYVTKIAKTLYYIITGEAPSKAMFMESTLVV